MTSTPQSPQSPLRRAIVNGALFAVATFAFRAISKDSTSERFYSAAPLFAGLLFGLLTYFKDSGRTRALSTILITLGAGGIVFWTAMIIADVMPGSRAEWPWMTIIYLFPTIVLVQGLRLRARATPPNAP